MARLVNPAAGTVVSVGGDLEALYRSRGWLDTDAAEAEPLADVPSGGTKEDEPEAEPAGEAEAEPVKRKPGRPKKSD